MPFTSEMYRLIWTELIDSVSYDNHWVYTDQIMMYLKVLKLVVFKSILVPAA